MLENTYRKFKDNTTFKITYVDYEDYNCYCNTVYELDSDWYDIDFILANSVQASIIDIIKYKYKLWKSL